MKKIIDYETEYGYVYCNLKYLMDILNALKYKIILSFMLGLLLL